MSLSVPLLSEDHIFHIELWRTELCLVRMEVGLQIKKELRPVEKH